MATAEQVLAIARGEIGTVQGAGGTNPYGRAYGVDRVAWCAQFVWWVFRQAGAGDLIHPKTAYTPTSAQWFIDRGAYSSTPRVGDCVYFQWPGGPNRISHIGLVEAVERDAIVTVEGNTTPPAGTGSQRMGGGVWRRRRARNSTIRGYGQPAYAAVPAPNSPIPEDDMPSAREIADAILDTPIPRLGEAIPAELRGGRTSLRNEVAWLTNAMIHAPWSAAGAGGQVAQRIEALAAAGASAPDEVRRLREQLAGVEQRIGAALGGLDSRPVTGGGSVAGVDVRAELRAALAELGPMTLTLTQNGNR
ncbi:CHAP domain-containing protein [Pseudonocardia sp. McavD-2-B]|uniref:CHAP domain-containing protein n=1 Tax=Pseudonocardia sp. McavD-2-B TaxID=2954499 RepID=UPI0020974AE6|nr:CHAP domain-containing protein [Pseudonocardia sp. McavD-2-B]MCO7195635.1 CHAP domain-containing protein [Pseudonocardia sp. McavD-2-B]